MELSGFCCIKSNTDHNLLTEPKHCANKALLLISLNVSFMFFFFLSHLAGLSAVPSGAVPSHNAAVITMQLNLHQTTLHSLQQAPVIHECPQSRQSSRCTLMSVTSFPINWKREWTKNEIIIRWVLDINCLYVVHQITFCMCVNLIEMPSIFGKQCLFIDT